MSDTPTTDRARRLADVASGAASDAVDRLSTGSNPGGGVSRSTSRSRQRDAREEIAADIDVDREGVGSVERLSGLDVFLRGPGPRQFGAQVREQFAGAADFVTDDDVAANVNREAISADPVVAPGRRDDVAQRAREQTASDTEFVTDDDLDVDVGARGVRGLEVAADRRDDVAERTRQALAADDPYATTDDFAVDVTGRGVASAGLSDAGAQRRAGRQFEATTPLAEVGSDDLRATDDGGFALDDQAQRRSAARSF